MISSLGIQNFRGITNLKIDDFQRINLFVGDNNSGKTTILEALFIIANPMNPRLPVQTNVFRDYKELDSDSLKMLFNKLDISKKIMFSSTMDNPDEKRKLTIKAIKKNKIKSSIENNDANWDDKYSSQGTKLEIDALKFNFSHFRDDISNKKEYEAEFRLKSDKDYEIDFYNNDYQEDLRAVFSAGFSMKKDSLSKKFNSVQLNKKKEEVIEILKKVEPKLEDLSIGLGDIVYADIGLDSLIPINSLGKGIIKLLYIVSSIADNSDGIVLIDEIENGFHYFSQKILWQSILEAADEFNVQLFTTTHSLETIEALKTVYSKPEFNSDNFRLYRIEKKNNEFREVNYDYQTLKTSLEKGWDIR